MKKIFQYVVLTLIMILCLMPTISNADELTQVTEIQVNSPTTGTYEKNQLVTIHVYFNNKITGDIPTLQIKFGKGDAIEVKNGIIHNDEEVSTYGQYIEYTYIVQDTDSGKLSVVGLVDGTLVDVDGKDVKLSAPALSGGVEITAYTKEDKNSVDSSEEKTSTNSNKENKKDKSTASGKLPYTGVNWIIVSSIVVIFIIGAVIIIKYIGLKDI